MTLGVAPKRSYDVFLSHHHDDKPIIEILARNLKKHGIRPWLDKWNLIPGTPWQPAIETALAKCRSCAVFLGSQGSGPWQVEEMRAAIDRRVHNTKGTFRVIPVLLPGARRRNGLSSFLSATTWVEFRSTIEDKDAVQRLVCGIRGIAPGDRPVLIPTKEGSRMQVEIRLTGSPKQFKRVAEAAEEFLQKASDDTTLNFRYIKKGSILLGIDCSLNGWRQLRSSFASGQLTELLGYKVESVKQHQVESVKTASRFSNGPGSARKWYVVDASGQTLGRLASGVASILAGKKHPNHAPFTHLSDHVMVINAGKIRVAGMKAPHKLYRRYAALPAAEAFRKRFDRRPELVVQETILGMLPKNKLGRAMGKKLKVYRGDEHISQKEYERHA